MERYPMMTTRVDFVSRSNQQDEKKRGLEEDEH